MRRVWHGPSRCRATGGVLRAHSSLALQYNSRFRGGSGASACISVATRILNRVTRRPYSLLLTAALAFSSIFPASLLNAQALTPSAEQLEMLRSLSPEQREYLSAVKDSADSLLSLLEDILDFSKIEARRLDLEQTDFNLRDLLEDSVRILALRADAKNLELACHIPPEAPEVLAGKRPPSRRRWPSATHGPLSPGGQKPKPSSENSTVGVKLS